MSADTTARQEKVRTDKSKEDEHVSRDGIRNIDRLALLKDGLKGPLGGKSHETHPGSKDTELGGTKFDRESYPAFSNIYPAAARNADLANSQAGSMERGMRPSAPTTNWTKNPENSMGTSVPAEASHAASELGPLVPTLADQARQDSWEPSERVQITGDPSKLDPKKPTVAFLDRSGGVAQSIDGMNLSHGQISALGAAKHGFNAVILDTPSQWDSPELALTQAADLINDPKSPLVKGDVLNVSMGSHFDPTFDRVNQALKPFNFSVTPENLRENRGRLLAALKEMAKDPNSQLYYEAQRAVTSNEAIRQIQEKGLEVVHAAGNEGPDKVDLNFLLADHQLSSVDPKTGLPDNFSASNSLTEPGNGVLEVRRQDDGSYRMGDVTFTKADLCALHTYNCTHENKKALNAQQVHDIYSGSPGWVGIGRPEPTIDTSDGPLVGVVLGTSYSNIDYLARQKERLIAKKLGQE